MAIAVSKSVDRKRRKRSKERGKEKAQKWTARYVILPIDRALSIYFF